MSKIREWLLSILLRKEVKVMAIVYAILIIKGRRKLDQVPELIRSDVEQVLADLEVTV